MSHDVSMNRYAEAAPVDVVVVGTGAGGAPLLAALARRGLSVVALEAGPAFEPSAHTPDEVEASEINWMEERLSGGADPVAFGPNNSGRGVGGSTLHWGAFTPRPDPRDIRLRQTCGVGEDWPVEHAELVRYLARVERFIGVCGPSHYPWDPARRYRMPPPPRNAPAQMMARGCEALGLRATDSPAAVLTRDRRQAGGMRFSCIRCGACHQGCRATAKATTANTWLPLAVRHGAEIRAEATVHGIETDGSGRITGVVYRRNGSDHRQRCAHLVLAAGGVETPRLLLHAGLANANGQVGRNFMAHGAVQVWARFEEEIRGWRGYPSSLISEDMVRPGDADFAGGYLIQSLGVLPVTLGVNFARAGLWGEELVAAMGRYAHLSGVGINAECLPYDGNRLVLSDEADAIGMPKARVDFTAGDNEKALDRHAVRTLAGILEAAGGRDPIVVPRTAHTIGTCRMGVDPARSVVSPGGRSHEIANLWICDNSVFPSSLIANPALTIMALSLRTAERFLAQ